GPLGGLRRLLRPPIGRSQGLSREMTTVSDPRGSAVTDSRFTPLQRLLHWLMAIGILSMLFIGVGMVSTVTQTHLTLVSIHKPLGVALLALVAIRVVVRLIYG